MRRDDRSTARYGKLCDFCRNGGNGQQPGTTDRNTFEARCRYRCNIDVSREHAGKVIVPIDPSWVHDGWIAWMLALYSRLLPVSESLMKYRVHSSQQVGLKPVTFSGRTLNARQTTREDYLLLAGRIEALRKRWQDIPGEDHTDRLRDLDGRIALLHLRADLPKRRIQRLPSLLRSARAYQLYAEGWQSIAKDLFLPRT